MSTIFSIRDLWYWHCILNETLNGQEWPHTTTHTNLTANNFFDWQPQPHSTLTHSSSSGYCNNCQSRSGLLSSSQQKRWASKPGGERLKSHVRTWANSCHCNTISTLQSRYLQDHSIPFIEWLACWRCDQGNSDPTSLDIVRRNDGSVFELTGEDLRREPRGYLCELSILPHSTFKKSGFILKSSRESFSLIVSCQ